MYSKRHAFVSYNIGWIEWFHIVFMSGTDIAKLLLLQIDSKCFIYSSQIWHVDMI